MKFSEEFEEAFNIVAPEIRKLGFTDDEIRWELTRILTPTPEDTGDMVRDLLTKLNT